MPLAGGLSELNGMPAPLPISQLHQVLPLLQQSLIEAGLEERKVARWLQSAAAQHAEACRAGLGAWFVEEIDGRPVGMAGALICEDYAFLSFRSSRHGRIVDEYVCPEYRNQSVGERLYVAATAWLVEQGVGVRREAAPNAGRLAASSGCLRL